MGLYPVLSLLPSGGRGRLSHTFSSFPFSASPTPHVQRLTVCPLAQPLHAAATHSLAFTLRTPTLSLLCVQPFFNTPPQPLCEPPRPKRAGSIRHSVSSSYLPLHTHGLTPFTHTPDSPREDALQSPSPRGTPRHPSQRRGRPRPRCPPGPPVPPRPGGLSQAAGTGRGAAPGGAGARASPWERARSPAWRAPSSPGPAGTRGVGTSAGRGGAVPDLP